MQCGACIKDAGLALLINDFASVSMRGRDVQMRGLRWDATEAQRDHSDDAGAEKTSPNARFYQPGSLQHTGGPPSPCI